MTMVIGSTFGVKRRVDPKFMRASERRELERKRTKQITQWYVCGINEDDIPEWECIEAPNEMEAIAKAEEEFNWDCVSAYTNIDFAIAKVSRWQNERGIYETDSEILKGGFVA